MSKKKDMPSVAEPSDEWEIQSNLDTITKAHELMEDEDKMMKVQKLAGKKMKALKKFSATSSEGPSDEVAENPENIKSIKDLRSTYNRKFGRKGK